MSLSAHKWADIPPLRAWLSLLLFHPCNIDWIFCRISVLAWMLFSQGNTDSWHPALSVCLRCFTAHLPCADMCLNIPASMCCALKTRSSSYISVASTTLPTLPPDTSLLFAARPSLQTLPTFGKGESCPQGPPAQFLQVPLAIQAEIHTPALLTNQRGTQLQYMNFGIEKPASIMRKQYISYMDTALQTHMCMCA